MAYAARHRWHSRESDRAQAGGSAGNITGQALGGGRLVATSTGDASLQVAIPMLPRPRCKLRNSPVCACDLFGGQAGATRLRVLPTAISIPMPPLLKAMRSALDVNAYAIYDANGDGRLRTSGNVQAIATLINTVIATTVWECRGFRK